MSAVLASAPPASRPWLSAYPDGVPAEVANDPRLTLVDVLESAFRQFGSRPACVFLDETLRFRDIDEMSSAFGAWLQSKGLAPGARVALMMPNVPQYAVAIAAVLRAGYVVVNVNPLYTPRELEHQLSDAGAEAIVILENFAHTLEEVLERTSVKHVVLASMGELLGFWKGLFVNFAVRHLRKMVPEFRLPMNEHCSVTSFGTALAEGMRMNLRRVQVTPQDVAFLQYTGGTTGVSKGATLLHRNVVANVMQFEAWMKPRIDGLGEQSLSILCALPMYHIYALTVCYLMGARMGAQNVLVPNPRDIPGLVKTLGKHPVHILPAVNTLFNALTENADFGRLDFSRLLISAGGGMAVQKATAEQWKRLTGTAIIEGYGLSETSPVATSNRLDLAAFSGTIGLPVPSTEIVIRDDDGRDLPPGDAWRDLHSRPAGDGGLLETAGRNGQGHDLGRLPQVRRYRRDGRTRLRSDRRPQEGHDPGVWIQRVPERDRADRQPAPRSARMRCGRHTGQPLWRVGQAFCGQAPRDPERG